MKPQCTHALFLFTAVPGADAHAAIFHFRLHLSTETKKAWDIKTCLKRRARLAQLPSSFFFSFFKLKKLEKGTHKQEWVGSFTGFLHAVSTFKSRRCFDVVLKHLLFNTYFRSSETGRFTRVESGLESDVVQNPCNEMQS